MLREGVEKVAPKSAGSFGGDQALYRDTILLYSSAEFYHADEVRCCGGLVPPRMTHRLSGPKKKGPAASFETGRPRFAGSPTEMQGLK